MDFSGEYNEKEKMLICALAALTVRKHRLEGKNPISEADLEWIFARNYRAERNMDILIFLSEFMVPLTVFYIVGSGILTKRPVFDDFLDGAKKECTLWRMYFRL